MWRKILAMVLALCLAQSPVAFGARTATAPAENHVCPCCPTVRACNCGCAQAQSTGVPGSSAPDAMPGTAADPARWCFCGTQPATPPRSAPTPASPSRTLAGTCVALGDAIGGRAIGDSTAIEPAILPLLEHSARLATTRLLI